MRSIVGNFFCYVLLMSAANLSSARADDGLAPLLVGTPAQQQAEVRIREVLLTPLAAAWDGERLDNVLSTFETRLGVNVSMDKNALEAINITGENLVTLEVHGQSARAALESVLRNIDPTLTWTIDKESLVITTKEAAQEHMQTKVYPVGDLVVLFEGESADFEPLIELIQRVIEPQSWDAEGGPGSVYPFEASMALVFTQTRDVHEKVEQLLESLRKARPAARIYLDAYQEALKASGAWEDVYGSAYSGRFTSSAPNIDYTPAPWRLPQRYDE